MASKAEIQAFEAKLDAELAGRPTLRFDANAALALACNIAEYSMAIRPFDGLASMLSDGIETFAPHLVSGNGGAEPEVEPLVHDLIFGGHYHRLRDLLYYSYNAPGSIVWTFDANKVDVRFGDHTIPRQFFTSWNEWVLLSMRAFGDDFTAPDELRALLKGMPEFELTEAHDRAEELLRAYADRKLESYFSFIPTDAVIDLGGYSYRDFVSIYRVLMMKALYHRYQADVNDAHGCIFTDEPDLVAMLSEETEIPPDYVTAALRDLIFDRTSIKDRVDPSYCSLLREGAAPGPCVMRRGDFSRADGMVQLLRVVAQRRPEHFLSNVSGILGTQFVQRAKTAFEAQGFLCRSEVSLTKIDPALPDIDLLVISEEPTLGYVMFVCEMKSPLPPLWGKDQLRVLAKDSVSKAFRQTEAIQSALKTRQGIEFIRSVAPPGGLEHFDDFVIALRQLIITSDNAGMFFGHEGTPIMNFRTLERLLERSDGDVLHIMRGIDTYNEGADKYLETTTVTFDLGDLNVSYEQFKPTALMDFPQNSWRNSPARQQMIADFVAGGHHPFDCLEGREVLVAPPAKQPRKRSKRPPAKPS